MSGPASGSADQLEGILDQIVYQNEENGYTVARLAVKGAAQPATITGNLLHVSRGESLRCRGGWVVHPRFGRQFRVDSFDIIPPATKEGIVKYLSSGLIKGIGPKLAERMVARFGGETLRIIDEQPERLAEVPGIGRSRIKDIAAARVDQKEIQEIMVFLRSYGVGQALAAKVYALYGRETVRLIKRNPYRLCEDLLGVGFKTADRIALNLGVEADSPFRIRAVITHILDLAANEGHLCLPHASLVARSAEAVGGDPQAVEAQIALRCEEGSLVVEQEPGAHPEPAAAGGDRRMVFLKPLYDAERELALRLNALKIAFKPKIELVRDDIVRRAEAACDFVLDESQREAVFRAMTEPILIITGGPGVGKTAIVRAISRILSDRRVRIALAAPTGRAAKRLTESTGLPAATIHRLLKFNPRTRAFEHDRGDPVPADYVICDECSMVDVPLAAALMRAIADRARVLLVGDADQLPSVGPGNFLRDLIASEQFAVVRLNRLYRQEEGGGIITAAHAVNAGEMPDFAPLREHGECFFIEESDAEKAAELIVRLVRERIPARFGWHPVRDVQVITPMHKGPAGTENLNAALRAALNPDGPELSRFGRCFRPGDKVMQIRNNYDLEVFNGDIGVVESIDAEAGRIAVRMDDVRVDYESDALDELTHAYCVSVHKSQGCEFPAVVMPLLTQHFLLLKRNLLYTGITRARGLLVIVGARRALRIAVGNDAVSERHSLLPGRLRSDPQL